LRRAIELSPERLVAHVNLVDVLTERGGDTALLEALRLIVTARELGGNDPLVVRRQAVLNRRLGREDAALRLYATAAKGDPSLALEIGDYYRELLRDDDAAEWYKKLPKDTDAKARLEQLEIEREARRFGWSPTNRQVSQRVRNQLRRAEELLGRGQIAGAEELARNAALENPQFAEAHRTHGDALAALGKRSLALDTWLRGFVVEPNNAGLVRRIALAYRNSDRLLEAAVLFERALQLRPDWHELRLELALSLRESGDLPGAFREINRFLEGNTGTSRVAEATQLQGELATLLKAEPTQTATAPNKDIAGCLNRAQVLLNRGQAEAALGALNCGDGPEVQRLRARILFASGRAAESQKALAALVSAHSTDASAHYDLGRVRRSLGDLDGAWSSFHAAESLGMVDATFQLADLDLTLGAGWPLPRAPRRLLRAHDRLERYLERPRSTFAKSAQSKIDTLERTAVQIAFAGGSVAVLLATLVFAGVRRSLGGLDLATFLQRQPEAGAEVQSTLAAIRHEVLKHNTTALEGLVAGLRRLDDVDDELLRLDQAIFDDGVARKLDRYVDDLERIGRRYDERLNLRTRDQVIRPLVEGFAILEGARKQLRTPPKTLKGKKALTRRLERASKRLNDEAYRAVLDFLREIRELSVDRALLNGVGRRTAAEPSFSGVDVDWEITGELPQAAIVPRTVFEDIMTNLIRNALQATLIAHPTKACVRLHTDVEVDDLTGESFLTLTVYDQAPGDLQWEAIESAPVESGLGIVRECAAKSDAIVRVVPGEGPWRKGVQVAFVLADSFEVSQ
ncbi:MAG: tetratricopeptide repeat protein, partial [Myxococcota bacterium]